MALAVSACTATTPPDPVDGEAHRTLDASTAPSPTALERVVNDISQDDDVLGFLENQSGLGSIGPLSVNEPALVIYAACAGPGSVSVSIAGVGSFPVDCENNKHGVRNEFDVEHVEGPVTVNITGNLEQRWAVTVVQSEPSEREP